MKKNFKVIKALGTHKEGDITPFFVCTGNELVKKGFLAPLDGSNERETNTKPKRTRAKTK